MSYKHLTPSQDVFQHSESGLSEIKNVRQGRFGSICDGSKPLKPFMELFHSETFFQKRILKKGLSTPTDAGAPAFLKSKANNPLSTSEVHDCSVAYFYNQVNNTHFLYHIHPNQDERMIKRYIRDFMPEGFQKACIIPGRNYWTVTHKETLPIIFNAIKSINPKSHVEVFHYSTEMPEIVGYRGSVYEILNKNYYQFMRKEDGQATFKITDTKLKIFDSKK